MVEIIFAINQLPPPKKMNLLNELYACISTQAHRENERETETDRQTDIERKRKRDRCLHTYLHT